ncbi:MAG: oligosaccharide flippase family protein [Candidatus Cloacimonetes bacterium]|nr:oligosaccharide flippase family protein [Candidatus Cloacimonadota bacterium]
MNTFIKNSYLNHKETIYDFIWRALQIFGKQGITFIIFFMCAKLLTSYDFGVYNYILAVIYLLIIFGDFGISTATSKYVAEYNATNKGKLRLVLFNSLILIIGFGTIVTLSTILFGSYFLNEKYVYVLYVLPMLFLAPISSLYDGIFRGLKRFKELAIISLSIGLISIIFISLLVQNYGLIGALISHSLFYLVLVLALFFFYGPLYFQFDKQLMKTIFNYSLVIGFTSVSYFLYTKVDLLVLGYFGYYEEIGYYEVVNKIFELIKLPILIIATVLAPSITSYYSKKQYLIVKKKFNKHVVYSLVFGFFLTIVLYFSIPFTICLFLNEYFTTESVYIFNLLLIILPLRIVGTIVSQAHTIATGNAHFSLWTMIPAGVTNFILDIIFINYYGFIGVVYSTIICFSFAIISFIILYNLKLNKLLKEN